MKAIRFIAIAILASVVCSGVAQSANITNGSFETPVLSAGEARAWGGGSDLAGWTVLGGGVYVLQTAYADSGMTAFTPHHGLNALDITGEGNSGSSCGVRQTIATVVGETYTVQFFVGRAASYHYTAPATVDLSVNGGPRMPFTGTNQTPGIVAWQPFRYQFTATTTATTLAFLNNPGNGDYAGLDSVSVAGGPGILVQGDLAFGTVTTGATAIATLLLANTSPDPVTVTGLSCPAGFSGSWTGVIPPGSATNVTVAFAPVACTNYGGTLSVNSDAAGGFNSLSCAGTGASGTVWDYAVLHTFDGSAGEGANPLAAVTVSSNRLYGLTQQGGAANSGVLFRLNPDGTGYTNLHTFGTGAGDGAVPLGSLLPSGGAFYGLTSAGGNAGQGALFRINPDGSGYTNLHEFAGGEGDGAVPLGSLIQAGSALYGLAQQGGVSNLGVVFKINLDGSGYTNLHEFTGSDGAQPSGSLLSSAGRLYGLTANGGQAGFGVLFQLNLDGTGYTNLHDFVLWNGTQPYGSLVQSGGVLYGLASAGGDYLNGVIFQINTNGTGYARLHSFAGGASDGATPEGTPTLVGAALFGLTSQGGTAAGGTVFAINTDGSGYTNLHIFGLTATDGANPWGTLTPAGATLYGLTASGGWWSQGTLFALTATPVPAKIIGITGNLAFGGVVTGATATATLTLANAGNTALTITGIAYPTGFTGAWSGTIPAGGATNVTVSFHPTTLTTYSGTITVASDATGGAGAIPATGAGIVRVIGVAGNLAFGNVVVGESLQQSFTITNGGNATLTITDISYPPGYSGPFAGSLAPGTATNVLVTFTPPAAGNFTGALTVNSDATAGASNLAVSGTGYCVYALSAAGNAFPAAGGPGSFLVTTPSACLWAASTGDAWLHTASTGSGNGTVNYTVDAFACTGARTGTIAVADQTYTVIQTGVACTASLSATSTNLAAAGGAGNFNITTQCGCAWNAAAGDVWLHTTSTGSGNGAISYTVDAFTCTGARTGAVTVASRTFLVVQTGVACTPVLSATGTNVAATAASGNFTVNIACGCDWSAATGDAWLHTTSTGTGTGAVSYAVDAFACTGARTGAVTVAGQTFTVIQAGVACLATLSATSTNVAIAGGSGSFDVQVACGCAWSASAGAAWLHTASTGTGTGTVSFTVDAFACGGTRTGAVIAAGQTFTVVQTGAACTQTLSATATNVTAGSATGSFTVNVPCNCAWAAVPGAAWLHTTSTGSGTGTVSYTVEANTVTNSRTGTLNIQGQLFTITQAARAAFAVATYNGLILQTNAPSFASSGSIKVVPSKTGTFAANLALGGVASAFKGKFDAAGNATNTVKRVGRNSLTVVLHLDLFNNTDEVTGTVSDGTFTVPLLADKAVFSTRTPCPWAGKYNCLLEPTTNLVTVPQGDGYATFTVAASGNGALAGKLADGTALSVTLPVSRYGTWPLYKLLYASKGAAVGWLSFSSTTTLAGPVDWFKPRVTSGRYAAGFNAVTMLTGTKLTPPAGDGTWQLRLTAGDLLSDIVRTVTVAAGKVTLPPVDAYKLSLKVTPVTGKFTGSFLHPVSKKTTSFTGLFLQAPENDAGGFFLGPNTSGAVTLEP